MSNAISLNRIQALIPAYRFSCRGIIVQWGVSTEKGGGHLIELQVWRKTFYAYKKIGGNRFTEAPKKGQKLLYLTPEPEDRIEVEPGDFIGMHASNNPSTENNYKIQYESSSEVRLFYIYSKYAMNNIHTQGINTLPLAVAPILHVEVGKFHEICNNCI